MPINLAFAKIVNKIEMTELLGKNVDDGIVNNMEYVDVQYF